MTVAKPVLSGGAAPGDPVEDPLDAWQRRGYDDQWTAALWELRALDTAYRALALPIDRQALVPLLARVAAVRARCATLEAAWRALVEATPTPDRWADRWWLPSSIGDRRPDYDRTPGPIPTPDPRVRRLTIGDDALAYRGFHAGDDVLLLLTEPPDGAAAGAAHGAAAPVAAHGLPIRAGDVVAGGRAGGPLVVGVYRRDATGVRLEADGPQGRRVLAGPPATVLGAVVEVFHHEEVPGVSCVYRYPLRWFSPWRELDAADRTRADALYADQAPLAP